VSAQTVLSQFEDINVKVKTVSKRENDIRDAMDDQNRGNREIRTEISRLTTMTGTVKTGSRKMYSNSQKVVQESSNLVRINKDISAGIVSIAEGVQEIMLAVHRINTTSGENEASISNLNSEIRKFKVS
jgi:uncharacterized phage infection (PIP) family protein YhgE